jgi:hypothetical protein
LLLLSALIVVPVWAADATPAPTSGAATASTSPAQTNQPATKKPVKKHKKKSELLACTSQICGGKQGCYQSKCGAKCTGCLIAPEQSK